MDAIIKYIKEKYHPLALIVYGSFADGSNNQDSDFDALAVVPSGGAFHDTSRVEGLQLDLFVYPEGHFGEGFDWDEIIQIFDGKILLDTGGLAQRLKDGARDYIAKLPRQSREESAQNVAWCKKMLLRTRRGDPEGMFRWHWLLVDSLEIFCGLMGQPYFGPKKALRWMAAQCPEAFERYSQALSRLDGEALQSWVDYLESCLDKYE